MLAERLLNSGGGGGGVTLSRLRLRHVTEFSPSRSRVPRPFLYSIETPPGTRQCADEDRG